MLSLLKNKIKWVLIGGFSLVGAIVVETQTVDSIIMSTTLTEVPIEYQVERIKNEHYFQDINTGEIITTETTDEEYKALALKGATQPSLAGANWMYSVGGKTTYTNDTILLNDYEYMVLSTSTMATDTAVTLGSNVQDFDIKIKLPNYKEVIIKKSDIQKGKITQNGLKKVKKKNSILFFGTKKAYAAITYDTSAKQNYPGTAVSSFTFPFTIGSGANRILFVQVYWQSDRTITAISYNGTSMTAVGELLTLAAGEQHGLYYVVAPTSGTNNISVTFSGTTAYHSIASSYAGVAQTSPINASRTETDLEVIQNYSESITSTVDNSWAVWSTRDYSGRVPSAGSNTVLRQHEQVNYGMVFADSGQAITPAGAYAMNLTSTGGTGNWYTDIIATFSPAAEPTSTPINNSSVIFFD